jgi:hypothetical protein
MLWDKRTARKVPWYIRGNPRSVSARRPRPAVLQGRGAGLFQALRCHGILRILQTSRRGAARMSDNLGPDFGSTPGDPNYGEIHVHRGISTTTPDAVGKKGTASVMRRRRVIIDPPPSRERIPERIPGLPVSTRLSGMTAEYLAHPGGPRRITIPSGRVFMKQTRAAFAGHQVYRGPCEYLLGPPLADGARLTFLNLTVDAQTVTTAAMPFGDFGDPPPIVTLQMMGPRPHKFSGLYSCLVMLGPGSGFELYADGGEWLIVAEHLIEQSK